MAALAWYGQGMYSNFILDQSDLTRFHERFFVLDRLLHPQESVVPFSTELSKELLELLTTMSEKEAFSGARNGYIKTHLVASILERVGQ